MNGSDGDVYFVSFTKQPITANPSLNFSYNLNLQRRFAKKKLLLAGSEVVLFVKQWLRCFKKENSAIPKTNSHFQKKTSPTADLLNVEEGVSRSINLEGLCFENRVTPRTHSEGTHFGQDEKSNDSNLDPGQSIVGHMKSKRKTQYCAKTFTVHSSSASDTLPSVE